jgi:4-diphosphocytidyl-2-C-methyl-D-erythritol kinase
MAGKAGDSRRVLAFAKINLSLRVLGLRPDGYHEVRTVLQSIALHDTLTIRAVRGPFALTCDDPRCPSDSTNLIARAADEVWAAAGRRGRPHGVSIELAKRIPLQAGLGGGSSDGAAALRALGRLWRVDGERLREIAAALGADVPFFFDGGTALGLERGDLLFPLVDHPAAWVVIFVPRFGVSTREAFEWWDALRSRDTRPRLELQNDLELVVAERHPQIIRLVGALRRAGASHAAMTGSGSAVFGLFASRRVAADAAAGIGTRSGRGTIAILTKTLNRARYQALAVP